MTPELITAFGNFGPMGLFVLFLYFEKKAEREHRREVELARAESDKALATSLAALTVTVQHIGRGQ
ncbi:hypothetical protein [Sphingopyxis granuli]|uniref:hypothetical protein n=1 Tax=Sphingopyxis granuli TaxID=267128 RepID=UPI001BAEE2FA|nr:hypothetical protein [Sphingopyxis granuli]QUM73352.1 hypothetical protein ICN83_05550 [Sphingopyxis granuli]